jgi:hypothetical protein
MTTNYSNVSRQIGSEVVVSQVKVFNLYPILIFIIALPLLVLGWRLLCEMVYILLYALKSLHKEGIE